MAYSLRNLLKFDDTKAAVGTFLSHGIPFEEISCRMIREEVGGHGSYGTISKHLAEIKSQSDSVKVIDPTQLAGSDQEEVLKTVADIVDRRTYLVRKEAEDKSVASAAVIRGLESDIARKNEVIEDYEFQFETMQAEVGATNITIARLQGDVARLGGVIEGLNGTIATLGSSLVSARESVRVADAVRADAVNKSTEVAAHTARSTEVQRMVHALVNGPETDVDEPADVDEPLAVETDRLTSGQREMPRVTDDDADKADDVGDDHG